MIKNKKEEQEKRLIFDKNNKHHDIMISFLKNVKKGVQ